MGPSDRPEGSARRNTLVALLAGVIVFVLLFQWGGGQDSDPPTCFGMFGWWTVPCGGWPAVVAGVLTAVIVWSALTWWNRRDGRRAAHR